MAVHGSCEAAVGADAGVVRADADGVIAVAAAARAAGVGPAAAVNSSRCSSMKPVWISPRRNAS